MSCWTACCVIQEEDLRLLPPYEHVLVLHGVRVPAPDSQPGGRVWQSVPGGGRGCALHVPSLLQSHAFQVSSHTQDGSVTYRCIIP